MSLRRMMSVLLLTAFVSPVYAQAPAPDPEAASESKKTAADKDRDRKFQWFRDARFGMFIHWGLYAVPAGTWKGKQIEGIGEWIMNRAKIPISEYELLAKDFNPVKFDAEAWVQVAKDAGMKYLVITSKHHDGFAMFDSGTSRYDIVEATPFKRDPLKELAAACQKAGIKFAFYYSQDQDWHEPEASGNEWDFPSDREWKKVLGKGYFEGKVKGQLRELLTSYGPIGLIWFDTPRLISKEQSLDLVKFVHDLQPDCLVSGRVGHGVGDYDSAGDNQISVGDTQRDWETPVTLNDTWGFKSYDHNWKSVNVLVRQLIEVAARNGNYLLNVGPTAEGVIPQESVDRLREVGQWMKVNGDAIYGSKASPFPYDASWGTVTQKAGKLYLHVFEWPKGDLVVYGLRNNVKKAYLLAGGKPLKVTQKSDKTIEHDVTRISVPAKAPSAHASIVVLEIDGAPKVDTALIQQSSGTVELKAHQGKIQSTAASPTMRFDNRGVAERWTSEADSLTWSFKLVEPGTYDVVLVTSEGKIHRQPPAESWDGGHQVVVDVAGQKVTGKVEAQEKRVPPHNPYWPLPLSRIGRVTLDKAGMHTLSLKAEKINVGARRFGFTLAAVELVPAKK
jgi:alpha-L-fucosidase